MYTLTLYQLLQNGYNLGLEFYPIFNEDYRGQLNKKIKNRYMFNEIGFETPERFIMELNSRMDLIMPYYNDLYNSYSELKSIGFNQLLHKSIGYEIIRNLNSKTDNTTDSTDKKDENTQINDWTNVGTTYGKSTDFTPRESDTTEVYSHDETNQTVDGKQLNLIADTPQSQINANLEDISNWDKTPFVSNGNLNLENDGKNETDGNSTTTVTHKGKDNTKESGKDTTDTKHGLTNDYTTDNKNNVVFDGLNTQDEHTTGYNFDYMTTYQKILEILTNIDNMVLDSLRDLFLYVY